MSYSISGFAYAIIFVSFLYFWKRLFGYWRKERNLISKLWVLFDGGFVLYLLIRAIGGLFFANNSALLKLTIDISGFLQAFIFAVGAYLIIHLKFPRISPWYGFYPVIILGLIGAILTIFIPFKPFVDSTGAINWGASPDKIFFITALLRSFLAFIVLIPVILINFQQFYASSDSDVRKKAFGLGLSLLMVVVVGLIDFLFANVLKIALIWRDYFYIIAGIILAVSLIVSQKNVEKDIFAESGR
ncbi:MAG: hypothetical protein A3A08_01170 [Candidatus Nealsonbacteria bacterium RIFCSPLOWO2_01_FULL_41_9]|uniref:Histidine kinase N-terminal 7TM region domain-containing protein n=1 Tax=Candidatus Nealsonbacteria bacterium RIFCSPLOWO2_01_FULL_41_9 TaxID=1801671 RepID=A0A1G2EB15_9BACT|nr:MAG: hypothetical protein A3A08_01170 [Candidatus Nealsonbacteria bacterium RIFCSPLOWO2_01_FULL_41_9]